MNTPAASRPFCATCQRARAALLLGAAALGLALLLTVWLQPKATAAAGPAPAASAPASAPARAAPELRFDRSRLRSLLVNQAAEPIALVDNGPPAPGTLEEIGPLPPGLRIDEAGRLVGKPTRIDRYVFGLRLKSGGQESVQHYQIDVVEKFATAAPKRPMLSASAALAAPGPDPLLPRRWLLTAEKLKTLTDQEAERAAEAQDLGRPLPLPTAEQLGEMLTPLLGQEFPTADTFRHAVRAWVCVFYRQALDAALKATADEAAAAGKKAPPVPPSEAELACPPAGAEAGTVSAGMREYIKRARLYHGQPAPRPGKAAPRRAVAPDAGATELTPAQFWAQLMSEPRLRELARLAETPMDPAAQDPGKRVALRLQGTERCGCVADVPADEIYAFLAWWHARKDPLMVNLGLTTRIGYAGAVLREGGAIHTPFNRRTDTLGFITEAHAYNARVDLVLARSDWRELRAPGAGQRAALRKLAERTAVQAVEELGLVMDDGRAKLNDWLLPPLQESRYAFDGLTLLFEHEATDPVEDALFHAYMKELVPALMQKMRDTGRRLRLNLVVPESALDEDQGAWSVDGLWSTWQGTEEGLSQLEKDQRIKALTRDKNNRSELPTAVSVRYLVMLGAPTSDAKKSLRALMDASSTVTGPKRVSLLRDTVPVLVTPREQAFPSQKRLDEAQFRDDVAYMAWNFGGIGLWPLPAAGVGDGTTITQRLRENYDTEADTVCLIVCPHRLGLRVALQYTLGVWLVALLAYVLSCDVRRMGRALGAALVLVAAAITLMLGSLLWCDPGMAALKALLPEAAVLGIALGFAAVLWSVLHKPPPPR